LVDRLKGKVAIITGGARGMGAATARLFVAEGAKVAITDILEEPGRALAAELGAAALFLKHDVTDEAQWQAAVDATLGKWERIDVLVNNAGILMFKEVLEITKAEFERVLSVNLVGAFLGIRTVGPIMVRQKQGSIVNISSADGMASTNGAGAYSASKWALRGLTKTCALELGWRGVRANSIHPGGVDTPMVNPTGGDMNANPGANTNIPLGRIGRPEEVAHASLYLASDDSAYVNGAELLIDGGMLSGRYYAFLPGAPP
jgi:3alpha(or 20beta)-hydroxysteroid dehydrogenase